MLKDQIQLLAKQYKEEFIAVRQHLHANPELSYKEFETSKFVQSKLTEFGIPFTVMAETGVVGIIEGKNPSSKIIALRADMDALPITETDDRLMASAATMGVSSHPVSGYRTPAAIGTPSAL